MAKKLKDDGIYVFDEDSVDSSVTFESHSWKDVILACITSRYFVLGGIFVVLGITILIMTTSLQFSGYSKTISAESQGVARQYSIPAPRGDIIDSEGRILATTESVNTLMIAYAGMEDADLNAMLLELSNLFDQYNCLPVEDLNTYFSLDPYTFLKSEEEIAIWQTNRNLFALTEANQNTIVTYSDSYVKQDPQVFFLYLRRLFKVDESYSEADAYRIVKLRYQIYLDNWAFQTGTPIVIAKDVPEELLSILLEQNYRYMGLIAGKEYRRVYTPLAKAASHVVGYVGKISQERLVELENLGYTSSDIVGQAGVESQMERYLHGQYGQMPYNIWSTDGENGVFYDESWGMDPVPGATVKLTIDSDVQQVGINAIKDYIAAAEQAEASDPTGYATASAGAFVMLDVHNGAVIAMGSYPDFDPSHFVLSMENDRQAEEQVEYYLGVGEYESITTVDMPLWNRAFMSQYAPGSTFKMVTALAALESGVITPGYNVITCESPVDIGGHEWTCLERPDGGHGLLSLRSGLATSCNIYFQKLGVQTGIDSIDAMGELLGLGELTGIDLPGETTGIRASRETKRLLQVEEYDKTWFVADTAQTAIGQFDNAFTILQLARYTAALATNQLVTPHVIDEVIADDGSILYSGGTDSVSLNLNEENLAAIREGMIAVGNSEMGTAYDYLGDFPISLACKTGTAETGLESINMEYSNGLFVCYAPADDPQIAIALVVEKGEWGSSTAIIAKKLMLAYFGIPDPSTGAPYDSSPVIGDIVIDITPVPASPSDVPSEE